MSPDAVVVVALAVVLDVALLSYAAWRTRRAARTPGSSLMEQQRVEPCVPRRRAVSASTAAPGAIPSCKKPAPGATGTGSTSHNKHPEATPR